MEFKKLRMFYKITSFGVILTLISYYSFYELSKGKVAGYKSRRSYSKQVILVAKLAKETT